MKLSKIIGIAMVLMGLTLTLDYHSPAQSTLSKWLERIKWQTPSPDSTGPLTLTPGAVQATPSLYPNIILHPDARANQINAPIVSNPTNAANILAGSNALLPALSQTMMGQFWTSGSGAPGTWNGRDTLSGTPSSSEYNYSDPALAFDLNGKAWYGYLWWDYSTSKTSIASSTDGGNTFTAVKTITGDLDRPSVAVDDVPASAHKNFVYWGLTDLTDLDVGDTVDANGIDLFRDSSGSWIESWPAGGSGYLVATGTNLVAGTSGQIYASFEIISHYSSTYANGIGFNRSTDGGRTWNWTSLNALSIPHYSGWVLYDNKVPGDTNGTIHVNSFPSMAVDTTHGTYSGTIYLVWANCSDTVHHLKPNIMLIKSTNQGTSWSTPVRVNNDSTTTQVDHWNPCVNVDPYGGVNVVFYDSRIDPTNNVLTQCYLARSTNGGATFKNYSVSDTAFTPTAVPNTNDAIGDNIGVTSTADYVYPCWMDNRRGGIYQLFTARFGPLTQTDALVASGWNMTSIPNVVSNFAATSVYPTATSSVYAYTSGGYVAQSTLVNGQGWFVEFPSTTTSITYTGTPIDSMSMTVDSLWNITGSISTAVPTSSVVSSPSGIISSAWYEYNNGYVSVDTVKPGNGYYLKVSKNGKLYQGRSLPKVNSLNHILPSLDQFTMMDARGQKQSFYFRNSERVSGNTMGADDAGNVEMPPPPPFDIFWASPASGNYVQSVAGGTNSTEVPLRIKSPVYPMKLSWNVRAENGLTYTLVVDGKAHATMEGEGTASLATPFKTISINVGPYGSSLPKTYALEQSYPNPFNPTTSIAYQIPVQSKVSLKVYDVLGREVATLVNGEQSAGSKVVQFNGSNLASGVYYYRLSAGAFSDMKKMLLIK